MGRYSLPGAPRRSYSLKCYCWPIWTAPILVLLCLPWSAPLRAQAPARADVSDDPEAERRLMQLADGFDIQLVASEPAIINPLSMNFDSRGRLWVLCAPRYPQILPGQNAKDYVVVLDDFAPDGRARKTNVFVDGLTVPTGIMPGDGGVYVGQGESLIHFRDTRGKGKADERKAVFTGFGTADTHHTLNTFRWGPDGALYFNQGVYIHSTVETPYGPRKLFGGGVWRLRTDRLRLDVYDRSILPNNTWGHAFDDWGQSFLASAWPGAINLCLPDSPLHRDTRPELVPDLKTTQIGGDRHCGLEVVSGRTFPDDWQGNLVTGDFLSHRVYRYALTDDGHRFVARPMPPLVVSKHPKFRPIDIKMGPDGAIYVADLYQQIIQHNQVDFRDPRRDHHRGRIWRIVPKNRPLLAVPNLVDMPLVELLDHLKDPELWTRQHVKRVLAERGVPAVAAGLAAWVRGLKATDANLTRSLLEALWAHQTIDAVDPALLRRLLNADDARARAAATRVLGDWADRVPGAAKLLAIQARDPHPRVRLEAVLAAGRVPSAAAAEASLTALDQTTDPLLDFALRRTTVLLQPYWYPAFQAGKAVFGGNSRHLSYALQAIHAPDALPALVAMYQAGTVPRENRASVLQILANLGDAPTQAIAWDAARTAKTLTASERANVLAALAQGARTRNVLPPGTHLALRDLFDDPDATVSAAALRLAGAWKLTALRADLGRYAHVAPDQIERQRAAVDALVELGGAASVEELARIAGSADPFATRRDAVSGLAALDTARAADLASLLLAQPVPAGADVGPLFTAFLRQKTGGRFLAKALQVHPPKREAARIGLHVLAGLGVAAPELATMLRDAAGYSGRRRKLDGDELRRLITLVQTQGDPARGEGVFRRPELGCQQCHALGGAGGKVGPDLSGIGTSAQLDYLIESVLLPSKIVREGYTTAVVSTTDGKVFSGVIQRESPTELVLRDPVRDEIVIQVKNIDEKRVGGSLMPEGLDQSLTDAELADLVRFLAELGRPGPFAVSYVPVARTWQRLTSPPARLFALGLADLGSALDETKGLLWAPVYAKVSGALPLREPGEASRFVFARCALEVTTAGKLRLDLNDARGVTVWVDGQLAASGDRLVVTLAQGVHVLTFRADLEQRQQTELRCELADIAGSRAQARFVGGR